MSRSSLPSFRPWPVRDLDPVLPGRRLDATPRGVGLGIADALDLVEARDRIADVTCVDERLFPFLGKCELRGRDLVLRVGAQWMRAAFGRGACGAAGRRNSLGFLDVASGGCFLTFGGHVGFLFQMITAGFGWARRRAWRARRGASGTHRI